MREMRYAIQILCNYQYILSKPESNKQVTTHNIILTRKNHKKQ